MGSDQLLYPVQRIHDRLAQLNRCALGHVEGHQSLTIADRDPPTPRILVNCHDLTRKAALNDDVTNDAPDSGGVHGFSLSLCRDYAVTGETYRDLTYTACAPTGRSVP